MPARKPRDNSCSFLRMPIESAQAEERKDSQDNDHQADEIDDAIHVNLPRSKIAVVSIGLQGMIVDR